ncbi:putative deoxyribodipyrimidine photo-lyase transcription factor C2H2 family [Helianthus anomalus]
MKLKLRTMEPDAQNPIHHLYSQQAFTAGYPNGGDTMMIRRRFEMRESIRRELEKERIREEIIAEEMARKRLLEAEVRRELMMERQMAMRRGGFEEASLFMRQRHGDVVFGQRRLIGDERRVLVKPIQVLGDSPKIKAAENDKEVIVLGKTNDEILSGTKRKSTPPVSEGSSQPGPRGSGRSRKKVKEEWSCAICQVSTTSERALIQHVQGKKHQVKEAALVAQKTGSNFGLGVAPKIPFIKPVQLALTTITTSSSDTNKPSSSSDPNEVNKKDVPNGKNKDKFKFWCEICQVGAFSEAVMNDHKEGKKHSNRLADFYRKGKVDSEASATENTCETKGETETKSNLEVVTATVNTTTKTG